MEKEQIRSLEIAHHPVAGVDEVGRGALFGEVVAAAVILPITQLANLENLGVTDSKKLSPQKREKLDLLIREVAIACAIGTASVVEIDHMNILGASLLAMERAIAQLQPQPDHCLIDGNQLLRFKLIPPLAQTTVIKGDSLSISIAAASIVAKVWRDRKMIELANSYPDYDLATNKGYGTAKHRQAITNLGYSDLHRKTFKIKEIGEKDQFV
ncbi:MULTISPECIES: ribonuclease HII [Pseudanabaena]|uniref:Ribonuclease HII n=2 Tax=Pseudanabaena TaxID=1152 RepID=L8MW71_9CYAN|nr:MULTISPECIES: ribonuclease HII [Pseudanabaena]ELS31731.1 RNase HII [Pseudanabaena biceps PCC 7429]MDG3496017.1 ribonuclease HII [Pseudanabaena catenata USMAC16]